MHSQLFTVKILHIYAGQIEPKEERYVTYVYRILKNTSDKNEQLQYKTSKANWIYFSCSTIFEVRGKFSCLLI